MALLGKTVKVLVALVVSVALLLLGVALMPARAVKLATDRVDGLVLGTAEGRLLRGDAHVAYRGQDLGRLTWSAQPDALLNLQLGTDWQIAHADYMLSGTAAVGASSSELSATGLVNAVAVNRFLSQYHISLDGMFEVKGFQVHLDDGEITAAGKLRWSGGRTVYRVAGETHDVELPGMVGMLASGADGPVLEVVTADDALQLMSVRLDPVGWVHIGVTARLTMLAGNPWHGDTDDATVVTVSERLYTPSDVAGSEG